MARTRVRKTAGTQTGRARAPNGERADRQIQPKAAASQIRRAAVREARDRRRARSNAKPEIMGRWVSLPLGSSVAATEGGAPLDCSPECPKAGEPPSIDEVARVTAWIEQRVREREAASPEHFRRRGAELSSSSRLKLKAGENAPDVLRDILVLRKGAQRFDLHGLLSAVHDLLALAFEATVGIGDAGLFNFERAVAQELVGLGARLREGRESALRIVHRQRLMDELVAIYTDTANAWGSAAPLEKRRDGSFREVRLSPRQEAAEAQQRDALEAWLKRAGRDLPTSAAFRQGKQIRADGGPVKAAARVLKRLKLGSDSATTKERTQLSPLFEYRATSRPFTSSAPDTSREHSSPGTTATTLARFAVAIYRTVRASSAWDPAPAAELSARSSVELKRRFRDTWAWVDETRPHLHELPWQLREFMITGKMPGGGA